MQVRPHELVRVSAAFQAAFPAPNDGKDRCDFVAAVPVRVVYNDWKVSFFVVVVVAGLVMVDVIAAWLVVVVIAVTCNCWLLLWLLLCYCCCCCCCFKRILGGREGEIKEIFVPSCAREEVTGCVCVRQDHSPLRCLPSAKHGRQKETRCIPIPNRDTPDLEGDKKESSSCLMSLPYVPELKRLLCRNTE